MITVERPLYLLLLLIPILLVYLRHFWGKRGNRLLLPFSFYRSRVFRSPSLLLYYVDFVSILFFWLSIVVIIVTIAGPVRISRERKFFEHGMDIIIVLDESPSMAARATAGPTRFDTARRVIRDFVQRRENDAVGLVSFSSEAALVVPPTLDYSFLIDSLQSLQIMSLGDGTAIGMGLLMAAVHIGNATEKVIILLTDGVNNTGEILPLAAARVAADIGIRVYTIGIGNPDETFVEFVNPQTGELYRGVINDRPDEDVLREIARITGGTFFSVNNSMNLEAVFETINSAETMEKHVMVEVQTQDLYREFIILALILLMAHIVISKLILGSGL